MFKLNKYLYSVILLVCMSQAYSHKQIIEVINLSPYKAEIKLIPNGYNSTENEFKIEPGYWMETEFDCYKNRNELKIKGRLFGASVKGVHKDSLYYQQIMNGKTTTTAIDSTKLINKQERSPQRLTIIISELGDVEYMEYTSGLKELIDVNLATALPGNVQDVILSYLKNAN